MRTMWFLLLVALPPAATWAQKETQAGQGAEMPPGVRYCGHSMNAGTFVDARARNASGEEAIVIRWLDPKGTAVHSALFLGRCLAKDGDTIDGRIIARVLPTSLAVSEKHARTAWEAEYWSYLGEQGPGSVPHRGVFSDDRWVAELDVTKASEPGSVSTADPDFRWDEERESLALKPGIVLVPSPAHYAFRNSTAPNVPAPKAQPCVVAPKPSGFLEKMKQRAERALQKQAAKADAQIGKSTGGDIDGGAQDATATAIDKANQADPCSPVKAPPAK